jgi:hypothetical protein
MAIRIQADILGFLPKRLSALLLSVNGQCDTLGGADWQTIGGMKDTDEPHQFGGRSFAGILCQKRREAKDRKHAENSSSCKTHDGSS